MSSYTVENETIDNIIELFVADDIINTESIDATGQELLDMNIAAVQQRYPDTKQEDQKYVHTVRMVSKIQSLKSLDCLLYQCTEGNIPLTELYKRLDRVRTSIYVDIVRSTEKYKVAEWA